MFYGTLAYHRVWPQSSMRTMTLALPWLWPRNQLHTHATLTSNTSNYANGLSVISSSLSESPQHSTLLTSPPNNLPPSYSPAITTTSWVMSRPGTLLASSGSTTPSVRTPHSKPSRPRAMLHYSRSHGTHDGLVVQDPWTTLSLSVSLKTDGFSQPPTQHSLSFSCLLDLGLSTRTPALPSPIHILFVQFDPAYQIVGE